MFLLLTLVLIAISLIFIAYYFLSTIGYVGWITDGHDHPHLNITEVDFDSKNWRISFKIVNYFDSVMILTNLDIIQETYDPTENAYVIYTDTNATGFVSGMHINPHTSVEIQSSKQSPWNSRDIFEIKIITNDGGQMTYSAQAP